MSLESYYSTPRHHKDDSIFISFEGIEGAGKSTQIELLESYLTKKGLNVTTLREPGGTFIGEKLREAILTSSDELSPLTETFIFLSSRIELLKRKILPLLSQKKSVVILDRYIDSTLSYQGKGRHLGFETILNLHSIPPLNLLPHKTFFLNIDEKTSQIRQKKRGDEKDYFERENSDFYHLIHDGFHELSQIFPERIITIDALGSINDIHQKIIESWEKNFG